MLQLRRVVSRFVSKGRIPRGSVAWSLGRDATRPRECSFNAVLRLGQGTQPFLGFGCEISSPQQVAICIYDEQGSFKKVSALY